MAVEGRIAAAAQGELPESWRALTSAPSYGESFLTEKLNAVMTKLFGVVLDVATQDVLDNLVVDYAGKCLALELINPAIDYWSKQPVSIGATGRNETKAYLDRSAALLRLRAFLVDQTRLMWDEVQELLPGRRVRRISNVPRVREITLAHTPNPYEFEQPFADTATSFGGPADTAGGGTTGTAG
jgi:hypothetical protein